MKLYRFLTCAFLAAAVFSAPAFAQEDNNKDENGKTDRSGYITNVFIDNTFIGVNFGLNGVHSIGNNMLPGINFDGYAGKWFSPSVGARLGYSSYNTKEKYENANYSQHSTLPQSEEYHYNLGYVHGDGLLNLSQWLGGYKESRVFNLIGYAHAGYLHVTSPTSKTYDDKEIAAGVGAILDIRLTKRLAINFDLRDILFSGRFHNYDGGGVSQSLSAAFGVRFTLGRTNWDRAKTILTAQADVANTSINTLQNSLTQTKASLADANEDLAKANSSLAKVNADNAALEDQIKLLRGTDDALAAMTASFQKVSSENSLLTAANAELQEKYDALLAETQTESDDIEIVMLPLGIAPITLYYDINSTNLSATELKHLDNYIKDILAKDPSRTFYLTGSADKATGTADVNSRLAAGRASKARDILISKYGLQPDQVVIKDAVIADNDPDGRFDRSVTIEH